jgi:hypothetical protein
VSEATFQLGVKPSRYIKAKFFAVPKATMTGWLQVIGQLDGGWLDWGKHGRGELLHRWMTNNAPPQFASDATDMAASATGLYINKTGLYSGSRSYLLSRSYCV